MIPRPQAPTPVVPTIPQLIDYAARNYGDNPFLLRHSPEGWKGYSFRQAADATHRFAALLEREGVQVGDRVGLLSDNRPEWGLAYLAILECGAVVVPLDAQLMAQEVGEILVTAGATHCVVSARLMRVLEEAQRARSPELRVVSIDAHDALPSFEEAQRVFPEATSREQRSQPDDLAVILFTSGTTGQAKGVMLSHANLLFNVEVVARTFELGPKDRFLSILPMHHTFESTGGCVPCESARAWLMAAGSTRRNSARIWSRAGPLCSSAFRSCTRS